jgi:acyl carrier protein
MLRQVIDDFLMEHAHIAPEKLADPNLKMVDLGLDSIGVVEMLFEVEDRYGFQIDDPMRFQHMTLSEVVADLESAVQAKAATRLPEAASLPL